MNGATPLLIPGNMCDARMWNGGGGAIRQALHAATGCPAHDADTTQDDSIVAMARRALVQVPGRLLLVGFSMGAIVAAEMALLAPERIAGLVLAGYNAGADLPERAARRPGQQAQVRSGQLDAVLTGLLPHYFASPESVEPALAEAVLAMGRTLGPDVFVRQSEALRLRPGRETALAQLACPVLYLAAGQDRLCPPEWHARWAEQTPGSALTVIAGAGHMAPMEQPSRWAAALATGLARTTAALGEPV